MVVREIMVDGGELVPPSEGEHLLTVADTGFSMLDRYARNDHCISFEEIRRFVDEVNAKDELGSLFPRAPISAVPRKYLRGQAEPGGVFRHIANFLEINASSIRAKRVIIDLRVDLERVPPLVISACKQALEEADAHLLKEVLIVL